MLFGSKCAVGVCCSVVNPNNTPFGSKCTWRLDWSLLHILQHYFVLLAAQWGAQIWSKRQTNKNFFCKNIDDGDCLVFRPTCDFGSVPLSSLVAKKRIQDIACAIWKDGEELFTAGVILLYQLSVTYLKHSISRQSWTTAVFVTRCVRHINFPTIYLMSIKKQQT